MEVNAMLEGNPKLADVLAAARGAGLVVRGVRRTGEVVVFHPSEPARRVTVNNRRKDTPRALLVLVRRWLQE
jgi:hypothetical protein